MGEVVGGWWWAVSNHLSNSNSVHPVGRSAQAQNKQNEELSVAAPGASPGASPGGRSGATSAVVPNFQPL
ncbi:hypothetical protein M0802_002399 [Mischocyttarus mexicanus]|nr:hypothetical protein M0802_002399 [Mischocyttarus mexicanus]